jgi:hypothetical protein
MKLRALGQLKNASELQTAKEIRIAAVPLWTEFSISEMLLVREDALHEFGILGSTEHTGNVFGRRSVTDILWFDGDRNNDSGKFADRILVA